MKKIKIYNANYTHCIISTLDTLHHNFSTNLFKYVYAKVS